MARIVFLVDHLRIMHVEQYDAVAEKGGGKEEVLAISLFSANAEYPFGGSAAKRFKQVTLFPDSDRDRFGAVYVAAKIVSEVLRHGAELVFFSHYERPYIFLAAAALRLMRRKVYVMNDSKFDDYRRFFWKELFKKVMYLPYGGAIVASRRSADYLRFLGVNEQMIRSDLYTTSAERVRLEANSPPAPGGVAFRDRNLVCVARLVPKKNHAMLLDAYALYVRQVEHPRRLILCGSGPLQGAIEDQISALQLEERVILRGNLPSAEVAAELASGLCLLLPSIEEQYGIVVLEAQAMGLPVILSDNCGARDRQVRSGVNGFVVEPDNPEGLAYFMRCLSEDEALWTHMAKEALRFAERGDVQDFVETVFTVVADGAVAPKAAG